MKKQVISISVNATKESGGWERIDVSVGGYCRFAQVEKIEVAYTNSGGPEACAHLNDGTQVVFFNLLSITYK